jgi:hypothetical protein
LRERVRERGLSIEGAVKKYIENLTALSLDVE